ncbi:MAG TPA: amino acid permease, partial [Gemmatimonadales bacterium]
DGRLRHVRESARGDRIHVAARRHRHDHVGNSERAFHGRDGAIRCAIDLLLPTLRLDRAILHDRLLAICTLLYVVVSAVLVGMVPYGELNLPAPMAYAMERIGAPWWIRVLIDVGAVLGIASVILVMLLGQSRVFYSMSRDGLLGPWAGKVHPRFRTPYLSTIYTGIAVCFATGLLPLQLLGTWVNIGTLLAFVLVCAGVWILRHTRPDLERPFRTPLVPLVPILGMLSCLGLMLTLPLDTWIRLAVWLVIGFAIYFGYSRKHSALRP